MNGDIKFLKELQDELRTQENDCQAAPRFWTIGDYKMIPCPEGYQDDYHVNAPNRDYYGSLNDLLNDIRREEYESYPDDVKEEFRDIGCEISAINWLKEHYDEDAEIVPVVEEHIIHPNTMFLTKAEAKEHLRLNHYHYSSKAHTYAMTAWRAPKVEKLLKILETFDWDKVEIFG